MPHRFARKRAEPTALRAPPPGWNAGLFAGNLVWDGYTFLGDAGPLRSLPCRETREFGGCTHVGAFLPLCATEQEARRAAARRLASGDARAQLVGDRRLIHPISIRAHEIYDLTKRLKPEEGDFVVAQLFHGDGKHPQQAAWRLAKRRGCRGILVPAEVPVLFLYARFLPSMVKIGPADPTPEE